MEGKYFYFILFLPTSMDLQKRVCDAGTELCRSTESFYVKELEQASLSVIVSENKHTKSFSCYLFLLF